MAFDEAHTLAEAVDRTNESLYAVLCLCFTIRMGKSLRVVSILTPTHRPSLTIYLGFDFRYVMVRGAAALGSHRQPGFNAVYPYLYDTTDLDINKVGSIIIQVKNDPQDGSLPLKRPLFHTASKFDRLLDDLRCRR